MYVQINAGRNDGTTPMSVATWVRFQADLIMALENLVVSQEIEVHYGQGTWEGVAEDSVQISHYEPRPADAMLTPSMVQDFDERLSRIKRVYGQDRIAVVIADSRLV